MSDLDEITGTVIESALEIHKDLGPGLLESVYERVLAADLGRLGLDVQRQVPVTFTYRGLTFVDAFRVDLLVNRAVVVEIKSVELFHPVHAKQVLTYLRLMDLKLGLLLNFGSARLKDGLRRVVNGLDPSASPRLRVNQGS